MHWSIIWDRKAVVYNRKISLAVKMKEEYNNYGKF